MMQFGPKSTQNIDDRGSKIISVGYLELFNCGHKKSSRFFVYSLHHHSIYSALKAALRPEEKYCSSSFFRQTVVGETFELIDRVDRAR